MPAALVMNGRCVQTNVFCIHLTKNPNTKFKNHLGCVLPTHTVTTIDLPLPLVSYFYYPLYYATHHFTTFQKCLLQPLQSSIIITTLMLADQ